MIITALNESPKDMRVAITPHAVKQYLKLECQVHVEQGAGNFCGFTDDDYKQAGAEIIADRTALLNKANILATINEPEIAALRLLPAKALVIGPFENEANSPIIEAATQQKLSVFSMNLIPRISRAQSMDSLSSQANLAGYRAVLEAVHYYRRAIPMMMTAAGMIQPAKVLVLGAGVAGLQAIATAKRLGAVIYAFDVRRAAKEQVESLGAEFIEVAENTDAETSGGYAQEMSEDYQRLQAELVDKYARMADIVICTALIPGKKAPVLLRQETVAKMKPGSVIVDLATARGGNCEGSVKDQTIIENGITIIGNSNLAGSIPATASELYGTNLVNLLRLLIPVPGSLVFNPEDEIIKQGLLCLEGAYLPFQTKKEMNHA